jgi:hypothetical protein
MNTLLGKIRTALGMRQGDESGSRANTQRLVQDACRAVEEVRDRRREATSRPSLANVLLAARDRE